MGEVRPLGFLAESLAAGLGLGKKSSWLGLGKKTFLPENP